MWIWNNPLDLPVSSFQIIFSQNEHNAFGKFVLQALNFVECCKIDICTSFKTYVF